MALLCLPAVLSWSAANDLDQNNLVDDEEIEAKYVDDLQKKAAAYRVERSHSTPSKADDEGALYHLNKAKQMLADDSAWFHLWRSTRTAEKGFRKYPYSVYAGDLLMMALDGYIARGRLDDVDDKLMMLWFYLPDYPHMGEAMDKALDAAEKQQRFEKSVNLDADEPSDVIHIRGRSSLADGDRIFRFLSLHGDRETVAPRAELALARSQLLSGSKEDLFLGRRSYEKFLETYPAHELTFTALVEHALSYLVGYRGDDYDEGALKFASEIIDQAQLETHGDEEKARVVQAYRKRIRLWMQDRDLRIARWYRSRGTMGLQWFMSPPGLTSWQDGARYYYKAVFDRDNSSPQGRAAAREIAEIPATPPRADTGAAAPAGAGR
jgi:hypothetical protein